MFPFSTVEVNLTWAQPPTATMAMAQPNTDTPACRLVRGSPLFYEISRCHRDAGERNPKSLAILLVSFFGDGENVTLSKVK